MSSVKSKIESRNDRSAAREQHSICSSPHRTLPIVDIAGPAGSGKSTVLSELFRQTDHVEAARRFRPFKLQHSAHCVRYGASILWKWFPRTIVGGLSKEQLKWMLYLQSWDRILQHQRDSSHASVLIDQGPVFYMATLLAFGPDRLKQDAWWIQVFQRWASTLAVVVLLDAPTTTLMDRIKSREKSHAIKNSDPEQMEQFLSLYRSAYTSVVSRLEKSGQVCVLRIDTANNSIESAVNEIKHSLLDVHGVRS